MRHLQLERSRGVILAGAAIVAVLVAASSLSPAVEVAKAQDDRVATMLEGRLPSGDPVADYVNDRLEAATAAAEAEAAEDAAATSAEPAAEASGEPAAEGSGEPEKAKGKDKGAEASGTPPAEPAADEAAAEGGDGTTATLSGSDVVVSSTGESNQVDRPGRHGKGRR